MLPLGVCVCYLTLQLTPKDEQCYQDLAKESLELRTRHALEETPAHQKRLHVHKDIWTQDRMRHFRIACDESELTIYQKKDKTEAKEVLQSIYGALDSEWSLSADYGIYTFPSNQFIAEQNCQITQGENTIRGDHLQIDLAQEILSYENPRGHLIAGPMDFTAQTLRWDKKQKKLFLSEDVKIQQSDQMTIFASQGVIDFPDLKPSLIVLTGEVRLISNAIRHQKSFAVADILIYNPKEETILLRADPRVLFWQEGLSLSAPQVLIHKDWTVRGIGDVHFALDHLEQDYIDNLFKQYL
ncbi:MAG: hypothetical protein A3D96_04340 [Chlamydiae bacterium RIFCSPHIGHO2_12_FULL_44_59]|nr:MAG: hypothetical protein A2796_05830 [Chlamydiae bacterium RIFCSPHIGHO2_01_FULL_44_39]OGN60072.1 MAG: hypothetical protein A3D96_04340 [Chlamydiae bacterium RIFCSPHIGHO2_12_FULL_44_59]OGN66246.1 MAG: hypothetical protein A2978_06335 [Chlamydiae bacterium RIFCSPLOWO2_01_FULL_44_52]OGN70145.1 MAG: hypothetical protein A3F79_04255 [Chlamydiae bacterium RIFCSPLOWO2_12_FULL_45_20]